MEITLHGYILAKKEDWKPEIDYTFSTIEMPTYGYVTVCPHTLSFTVPADFNPVKAEIDALNVKLDNLAIDAKRVRERIANLQSIEYTGAA